MKIKYRKVKSKVLILFIPILLFASVVSSIPVAASSGPPTGGGGPKYPDNVFLAVYNNCQNVTNLDAVIPGSGGNSCNDYQSDLDGALSGCSGGHLYVQETYPDSAGVYKTAYFIDENSFSLCLGASNTALNNLVQPLCANLRKDQNPGWDTCQSYQNQLIGSLGCGNMFLKDPATNIYHLNIANYTACNSKYTAMTNLHLQIIGSDGKPTTDPNTIGSFQNSSSSSGSSSTDVQCEDNNYALSWIFCKVIDGISQGIDWIYSNVIEPFLITKPVEITDSSGKPTPTFQIWSNFRIYGDIFLLICLLIVVLGEAIGGGVLDAYSVRKILPRLLIAAIIINISIYLVAIAIDLTNIVGNGIGSLLLDPFRSHITKNTYVLQLSPVTGAIGSTVTVIGVVGAAFAAVAAHGLVVSGLEFLLTAFLIPAIFVMFAILATIVLRRGLILFLLFISPVAFALYCLPNTEKYFRQWWDLLFRALLIYPIIAVMFALGNILSITITSASTSGVDGAIASLVGVISLFVPLFLIPFSFSIAGGLIGRFHEIGAKAASRVGEGLVGDKNDPDSWRNRAKRRNAMERNEYGLNARSMSARLQRPQDLFSKAGRARRAKTQAAYKEAFRTKLGGEFAESDLLFKAGGKNDQFLIAHANEDMAMEKRNKAMKEGNTQEVAAWDAAIASARQAPQTNTAKLASLQALAATGFQFESGQKGYDQLAKTVANLTGAEPIEDAEGHVVGASGANAGVFSNNMNQAQFNLRSAGRFDLGGINNGAGNDMKAGLDRASLYQLANSKPQSIQAMVDRLPKDTMDINHAVAYKELQAMKPNATGAVRDEIDEQIRVLENSGVKDYIDRVDPDGGTKTVRIPDTSQPSGYRTAERPVTFGDHAEERARTYERPNLDVLANQQEQ